jgi:hypothetical protein
MGNQNSQQAEQMMCLKVAEYLSVLRDALVETAQVLEDTLFEIDAHRRLVSEETSQEVLERASR